MIKLVDCNRGIAKGLFLSINGFCFFLAYCIFGYAVVDLRLLSQYGQEQATATVACDVIILFASLLLVAIANLGIIGALKRNLKLIYTYIGLAAILILIQMVIIIFVAVQRDGLQLRVSEWLRDDFFRNVTAEDRSKHTQLWDELQIRYECCGLNGPEDYPAIRQPVSLSCCPRAYRARTAFAQQTLFKICLETASFFNEGCEDEIVFMLRSDAEWMLGAAIFGFWIEGAGILLAMWVATNIKTASVQVKEHTVKY